MHPKFGIAWTPFFANASFLFAYDQEHVSGERVLPSDFHPNVVPNQGGDFDLSFNQGEVHVSVLNPILHQDWVFGQFDQGPGD